MSRSAGAHEEDQPQATSLLCLNCPNNFFPGVKLIWSCCGETYCQACWTELTSIHRQCSLGNHPLKEGVQGLWTREPAGESAVRQNVRAALLEETPIYASFKEETDNFKEQEKDFRSDLAAVRGVQSALAPVIADEQQSMFDTLNRGTAAIRTQSYHLRRHADIIAARNETKAAELRDLNILGDALEGELRTLLTHSTDACL